MAKLVAKDNKITVNGVDFSPNLAAVSFDISADEVETTAFGNHYRQRISGLKDASVSLDWHQDFGATAVDATLFPLLGSEATVVVTPTSGTVSSTNPAYSAVFLVTEYQSFASSVGDLMTFSTSWPLAAGTVTRLTS
jgi:hypothetical protein